MNTPRNADPHAGQPIETAGVTPDKAAAALILVHGRGGTAHDMLAIYRALHLERFAAIAPQAAGHTWYPHSFLAALDSNQPYLDSALQRLDEIVLDLLSHGLPSHQIALLGFSQGACLTSEYLARHPRHYGGAMILTGGLIGPPGTPRNYPGHLDGTPIFLGASDPDPHVPFERVRETDAILTRLGAKVDLQRYPGMPHTINQEELDACRTLLEALVPSPAPRQ